MGKALALAEQAVGLARQLNGVFAEGLGERVWAQALASIEASQCEEIEQHLTSSVNVCESGDCIVEVARTRLVLGSLAMTWGKSAVAKAKLGKAASQFEGAGLTRELAEARSLLGRS